MRQMDRTAGADSISTRRLLRVNALASGLLISFNLGWTLTHPGSEHLFRLVENVLGAVGPLAAALFVFTFVLRARRYGHSAAPVSRGSAATWLFGLAILAFAVGQAIWAWYEEVLHRPSPFPSLADVAYLLLYPLMLAAILRLPSERASAVSRTKLALDGAMIMAAVAAFSWYFLLAPMIEQRDPSWLLTALGLAYPLGDVVLVACVLLLWSRARQPMLNGVVSLLTLGILSLIVADIIFAYASLHGGYATGQIADVLWVAAFLVIGLGAQLLHHNQLAGAVEMGNDGRSARRDPSVVLSILPYALLPVVGTLFCYSWYTSERSLSTLGVTLGGVLLVTLVLLRQVLTILENQCLQRETHAYAQRLEDVNAALTDANARLQALATTDPLTDLPNHRALVSALDQEIERAHRYERTFSVLFIDLDHFKALNDTYGHAAGDAMLREFGQAARGTLRSVDTLGRWGGEEFVAILPESTGESALAIAERVRETVARHTFAVAGAHVTCSIGFATFPVDARDRTHLLALADEALYAAKRFGRNQVRAATDPVVAALVATPEDGDTRDTTVLAGTVEALAALVEGRDHYTGRHTQEVANLALRVAIALGISPADANRIALAGRLHDVGKVVIPDAVLRKAGPLTAEEFALMRNHPQVGAEVVSCVPGLRAVAPLIRAHHERWDGTGYPGGLAGEAIPLGARVLAVVDAYAAIISDRPYQPARSPAWAIEEIRRCSGTQFDPTVVDAFERVLDADPSLMQLSANPRFARSVRAKAV